MCTLSAMFVFTLHISKSVHYINKQCLAAAEFRPPPAAIRVYQKMEHVQLVAVQACPDEELPELRTAEPVQKWLCTGA